MRKCGCYNEHSKNGTIHRYCKAHHPTSSVAFELNNSSHWVFEGERQVRVITGHTDTILHDLYEKMGGTY